VRAAPNIVSTPRERWSRGCVSDRRAPFLSRLRSSFSFACISGFFRMSNTIDNQSFGARFLAKNEPEEHVRHGNACRDRSGIRARSAVGSLRKHRARCDDARYGMARVSLCAVLLRATFIGCLAGCAHSTTRMRVGDPIKVNRGVCFVHTSYEQNGKQLNWDDTTHQLARLRASEPHIAAGNSWATGSIVAAVVGTPAFLLGDFGSRGQIDMTQDLATGLLVGGVILTVVGTVMCVVSDGQYSAAGDAYNDSLGKGEHGDGDDRIREETGPSN
jgi:hypothetical protein